MYPIITVNSMLNIVTEQPSKTWLLKQSTIKTFMSNFTGKQSTTVKADPNC